MTVKIFFVLFISIVVKGLVQAENGKRTEFEDNSILVNPYGMMNFFYNHNISPRTYPRSTIRQSSEPTTNPFINYWQNILRNVRVPVPSITWNVTNPLTNLFTMPEDQPIRSTPEDDANDSKNKQRQKKPKRKSSQHKKRHRKNKYKIEEFDRDREQNEFANNEQDELFVQQYPNPMYHNSAVFFFDPETNAYYAVHRINPLNSYNDDAANYHYELENYHLNSKRKLAQAQFQIPPIPSLNEILNLAESQIKISEHVDDTINSDRVQTKIELPSKSEETKEKTKKSHSNEEAAVRSAFAGINDAKRNGQRRIQNLKPRSNMKYIYLLNGS